MQWQKLAWESNMAFCPSRQLMMLGQKGSGIIPQMCSEKGADPRPTKDYRVAPAENVDSDNAGISRVHHLALGRDSKHAGFPFPFLSLLAGGSLGMQEEGQGRTPMCFQIMWMLIRSLSQNPCLCIWWLRVAGTMLLLTKNTQHQHRGQRATEPLLFAGNWTGGLPSTFLVIFIILCSRCQKNEV